MKASQPVVGARLLRYSKCRIFLEIHMIQSITEVLRLMVLSGIVEILTAERSSQFVA
jgi:hypothetical protein